MSGAFNESVVEDQALAWPKAVVWHMTPSLYIAPETPASKHRDNGEVVIARQFIRRTISVSSFEAMLAPLDDRIEIAAAESSTRSALRDGLLPKLISGELRVKDAECIVRESMPC